MRDSPVLQCLRRQVADCMKSTSVCAAPRVTPRRPPQVKVTGLRQRSFQIPGPVTADGFRLKSRCSKGGLLYFHRTCVRRQPENSRALFVCLPVRRTDLRRLLQSQAGSTDLSSSSPRLPLTATPPPPAGLEDSTRCSSSVYLPILMCWLHMCCRHAVIYGLLKKVS